MEELKERIIKEGFAMSGNILKVDSFLNHQIDPDFTIAMGKEFAQRFLGTKIDRIVTIESSGIAIALATAYDIGVPLVFARKNPSILMQEEMYSCEIKSQTKKETAKAGILKRFLKKGERVLIIDDFLADGNASLGLCNIVEQAGCKVVGIGIVIEKAFMDGAKRVRAAGYRVESLARIKSLDGGNITFMED